MTEVTEDDRKRARVIIGLITDDARADEEAIALALAETRERAEDQHKRTCEQLFEVQERISAVTQERDRWSDIAHGKLTSGPYGGDTEMSDALGSALNDFEMQLSVQGESIKALEAENKQLQKRLAIFQRNAGLATTEGHVMTDEARDAARVPDAVEVLARHLAELDGEDPDQTTHQGQPNWERFYAMTADAHLKALAAAGYHVEVGPALVEALELSQRATASFQEIGGPDWTLVNEASDKTDAALALAKQGPQP